jgi:hypothetical protein
MALTCGSTSPRQSVAREIPGQSEVICVRGAIAPQSQWVLAGEFAVGSPVQVGWRALAPLSVNGMIVAASTTRGGLLSWSLLVTGSAASLAANVAVAQPTVAGRVIAAWPSFVLIGAHELLMCQVRRSAAGGTRPQPRKPGPQAVPPSAPGHGRSALPDLQLRVGRTRGWPGRPGRREEGPSASGLALSPGPPGE